MTSKKMYSLYKGKEAKWSGNKGIICGYDDADSLIMAVINGCDGWFTLYVSDVIKTYKNNPLGYLYVGIENLKN